jgi:CheY-like chemotaxis protein
MDDPSFPELKILVVDDSPVYRKLVEQSLSRERYTLLIAKNGARAVDLLVYLRLPLVLSSFNLLPHCQRHKCQSHPSQDRSPFVW